MFKFVTMASLHQKRFFVYISLVLTLGIFTPSLVKIVHLFNGHFQEKQCVAYGTDHIHSSDMGCDFHDFTLVSKLLIGTTFSYELIVLPETAHFESYYSFAYTPLHKDFQALRGPPITSLNSAV